MNISIGTLLSKNQTMTGTLKCQCGQVILRISDTNPRMKLECGCCDCRQALSWAQIQGGPKLPSHRPIEAIYFGNDIIIESGKENLQWYKLRKEGNSIRWVARCCFTTMVVHHPAYMNRIFATFSDAVEYGGDIPKNIDSICRIQMKGYPKDMIKSLTPFSNGGGKIDIKAAEKNSEVLNVYGKFEDEKGLAKAFANATFFDLHEVESKIGKTTKDYIDEVENDIIVLGLKEF